jgi:two-component system alkaline phosphatase synthesis response regulator PhoP
MKRILIIEDEPDMVAGLRDALEHEGFATLAAGDGAEGLELALTGQADAIILDLMLPKRDGMEVCRELRARNVTTPIVILTARGQVTDRVAGLDIGAGDVTIDFKHYTAGRGAEQQALTDQEVKLLRLLVNHPHEVISRARLLDEVWGYDRYPTTRTVDTFIWRLRQKIEVDPGAPRHLLTVRCVGYKFVP